VYFTTTRPINVLLGGGCFACTGDKITAPKYIFSSGDSSQGGFRLMQILLLRNENFFPSFHKVGIIYHHAYPVVHSRYSLSNEVLNGFSPAVQLHKYTE
jgi:hypothetical protein